jgi:hypothetical protein
MGLGFAKPIEKDVWKSIKNEKEIYELLERGLKKEKTELNLNTSLFDLVSIYKIRERFDKILNERLSYSPNKEIAKEEFKKELLETLDSNKNKLAEVRNIGYLNAIKGIPFQLIDLGYLLINEIYENNGAEEVFLNYSLKSFIDIIIEPLAEGVGIALYLNEIDNKIEELNKGFEINTNGYKAHVSFIDEPFKQHSNIIDIHERIEAYSNNLVSTNSEIKLSKVTGVEIIDDIEGINKYKDLIAHSTRELLKNIRLLAFKNDLTAINLLHQRLESKLAELKQGIVFAEKTPSLNDIMKKLNAVFIESLKSKVGQIQFVLKEMNNIIIQPKDQEGKLGNYYFKFKFNDEQSINEYDVVFFKNNYPKTKQHLLFANVNDFNIHLAEKIIQIIFQSKKPLFNVAECLDYHLQNSTLNDKDFKQFIKRIYFEQHPNLKETRPLIHEEFVNWIDDKTELNLKVKEQLDENEKRDKVPEDLRDKLKKTYLGLTFTQVDESYKYFDNFIFKNVNFDEYLICFDLDKPIEKYPTFINGNIAKFVKFLDGIETFTVNNKIAKERFGIKNYKQTNNQGLGDTKENINFNSKIKAIYKLNDIKIN